jgi:hypothetical protein
MKKNRISESGLLNWRILTALALCSAGAWLGLFSFTPPSSAVGASFSAPIELTGHPPSPAFFQADAEPEIKIDIFGNIYVTAIQGVPGGTDLWKSTDKGATFVYLGQPDGAQDHCNPPLVQCVAAGGGDDSIDVSSGGYLYVSSLWIGNITVSTSMDGGTGGTEPGQAWQVNPAVATIPFDDRQWIAAYGPQTVYMTYTDIGTGVIDFQKSTDAGKTFGPVVQTMDPLGGLFPDVQGNLAVDHYGESNGNVHIASAFVEFGANNRIWLNRSLDGGVTWQQKLAYTGPAGSDNRAVFPMTAVDRGGNVYIAFTNCLAGHTNCQVYYVSSSNFGDTWSAPHQVSNPAADTNTTTAVQPSIVAGSPGHVDIAWLGSAEATPDACPNKWHVYFAQTANALSGAPSFTQVQAESDVIHDRDICFGGLSCGARPSQCNGNRDMLEYFSMTLDNDGMANIAYADSANSCPVGQCRSNTWFIKQNGGPSAFAPPTPPAAASFGPNVNVAQNGGGGAEPNAKTDSHNCMFSAAPGNPDFWKSTTLGASWLAPVNPVADETGITGGDEDILTIPQASPSPTPDTLYFADLGLTSVHIRKSIDGGATWFAPGAGGVAGEVSVSSDRQWLAYDHVPAATDTTVYEMDHELATEIIRFSSSTNDGPWSSTSGIPPGSEVFLPDNFTLPNTNPGPAFTFVDSSDNTHKIAGVFCGSTVRTNRANPPFGKLLNVWEAIGNAPLTAVSPPGPFANYAVFKGVQDSPTTPAPPAGATTYGTNAANDFPAAAVDNAGNIYVAWAMNDSRINHFNVWYAVSHDHGKSFYGPFQISSGPGHAVMPWLAAGDAGRLDVVFYQTDDTQDPNTSTTDQWTVKFAQSLNAAAREPVFTTVQASDHVNHVGPICNLGLLCASGTRDLLDFFQVAIGPDGLANIVYADDSAGPVHPEFARQTGGPLALTNPVSVTCLGTGPTATPTVTPTTTPTVTPTATPAGLPDLIVSNITAGKQQGQKIRLIATIKNQGGANAGTSKTGFYLDSNPTPLGQVDTPPVSNGFSVTATFDWNTGSVKGTHTITAKADDTNVVAESNETNNTNSIQVTVK